MNFAVLTASGKVIVRPDTTWRNGDEALYVPDFVSRIGISPALFVHICRPGRSIGEKFAERYYDSFGCGALLFPVDFIDGSAEGYACASCLDHTTFSSGWGTDKEELSGVYRLSAEDRVLHECRLPSREDIRAAIARVSRICLLRSGDALVLQLSPVIGLCSRPDTAAGGPEARGETAVEGRLDGRIVSHFKIIF